MAGPTSVPTERAQDLRTQPKQRHPLPSATGTEQSTGSVGGANLGLTSKAGLIINDLFLIRLFGPLQPCSGIFSAEVPEEKKKQTPWQEDEFPTCRLGSAEIIT